jgi:hypothetical protein
MTSKIRLIQAVLFAVVVGLLSSTVAPSYQEFWPEPSPSKDPFYYVDYEKSDAYHRRVRNSELWPWVVGLAAGIPAGAVYYLARRPTSVKPSVTPY